MQSNIKIFCCLFIITISYFKANGKGIDTPPKKKCIRQAELTFAKGHTKRVFLDANVSRGKKVKVEVNGECCLKIFEKRFYRGAREILPVGHRGGFDLDNFLSYRFIECPVSESNVFIGGTDITLIVCVVVILILGLLMVYCLKRKKVLCFKTTHQIEEDIKSKPFLDNDVIKENKNEESLN